MTRVHIDFETRSVADLKSCGAWAYARHPTTEVVCLAYSVDGAPVVVLTYDDIVHGRKRVPMTADTVLVAHNAHFEYAIWNFCLAHWVEGWPLAMDPNLWDCTLARAAMCNLPISLDFCGAALDISAKKDFDGRAAMLKCCKPLSINKDTGTPVYYKDPATLDVLYKYCAQDVRAEMEIDSRLPPLPPMEKAIWNLDLKMNARGVRMDVDLASAAATTALALTTELNDELARLTKGAVTAASRVAEMKRYLATQGVEGVESLDKAAVNALLEAPTTSPTVKAVLNIRRQVGKSSTAKYAAVVAVADPYDHRARGLLQYHAAGTGRWGGRLIQPQNFPKGLDEEAQREAISAIKDRDPQMFSLIYGDTAMDTLSGALRGVIIPSEGKQLVVADYASIEPRVLFWLAGDVAALEMYRGGKDLYVDLAQFIYNNPKLSKKDSKERAVGKMAILGCGYGMGKDRFQAQCATFGVEVTIEDAERAVRAYRDKYSRVKEMWYAVEAAAKDAIRTPSSTFTCCGGKVVWTMDRKREFLVCVLPSGRHLRYYRPSIKEIETQFGPKSEIHYWRAGLGGRLEEEKTYGGSLVENITQAVARDIMGNGMLACEENGYALVLTVHDELVAESTKDETEFIRLMCAIPKWAAECPIAAEGWVGPRYRK